MNGFGRSKGQEGSLKILKFTLLIPTWHHRVGFNEIFTIGTVLMQLGVPEGQARRAGAKDITLSQHPPFRVGVTVRVINTVTFQKAKQGLSFSN